MMPFEVSIVVAREAPSMMQIDQAVVAMWYVAYETPIDMICMLRQREDHFQITWHVREYDADGKITRVREIETRRTLVPLADAIRMTRAYIEGARNDDNKVCAEWEVQRGARSDQEFMALIGTMPNAFMREATPDEAALITQYYGLGI